MVYTSNGRDNHVTEKPTKKEKAIKDGKINYLNYGEEDQMEIQGYTYHSGKFYLIAACYVLTLGLLRLFFHWYPRLHLIATHSKCSLLKAEKVLVVDIYRKFKSYFVKDIKIVKAAIPSNDDDIQDTLNFNLCDGQQKRLNEARIITVKKLTYIWDDDKETFIALAGLDKGTSKIELRAFRGQSKYEQNLKRIIYGNNEINVPVNTILTLLVLEALTPFYMFQLFSLIVWLCEAYLYYTFAIIIMSVAGISTSIIQTRTNQMKLRGAVDTKDVTVVCRGNNVYEEIPTTDLVPGDLIVIPKHGCDMQCDAVLLNSYCVVNESMLTGESVPITKTPLPRNAAKFDFKEDANHTLFNGTRIIQTRAKSDEKVYALVIRTGYMTTKGELVRSILYPPPADFKFETDSYKFIGILAAIAMICVVYTVVSKSTRKINPLDILIKSLDVITIAVPPALPAAMTVGKLYALNRLKNHNIFCINSRVINVSGSIDCVCFDKTGTLTEDELDMWGVVPVENRRILEPVKLAKTMSLDSSFLRGMATCHSLSIIEGNLGGDPLELKMFEATEWNLEDSNNNDYQIIVQPSEAKENESLEIGIVKQFQFSSTLQRMSVIVKASDDSPYTVFCKGSPEMVSSLSVPSSIPPNFASQLKEFTKQGYRVIGLGTKTLEETELKKVRKLDREHVECDLEYIGFIILENKLKPQSTGVIYKLKNANLKTVMITGDNIQTGVHVAKECQMVDPDQYIIEVIANEPTKFDPATLEFEITSFPKKHSLINQTNGRSSVDIEKSPKRKYCFAVSGKSWANIVDFFPEIIPKVIARGTIFARMSGMQKQQLIEELKNLDYHVAMCGDGANDCGALKAAHVGISLSEAESSVASPFTSKEQNISCVPKVIKEGRAALVTSFGVFKVMLCYSLTELASVMILYNIDANLSSLEFLFIDVCLVLNFAAFFGNTEAYSALAKVPPMASLMAFIPILSMFMFMVLVIAFQVLAFFWIQTYSWFTPFVFIPDEQKFVCFENYAVYCVSMFQYIAMVIIFSKGKPYRRAIYTNLWFTLSLLITTAICIYITVWPNQWVIDLLELQMPPMVGRYAMIVIAVVSVVAFWIVEEYLIDLILDKFIMAKFKKSSKQYAAVLKSTEEDPSWPRAAPNDVIITNERESNGVDNKAFVGSQDITVTKC